MIRHTLGSEYLGYINKKVILESDMLGADKMAEQIASDLRRDPQPVVGVYGRWGTGKTHLLNLLGNKLAEMGFLVACFRAWEYEAEGDLVAALLRVLSDEASYPFNNPNDTAPPQQPFFPDSETVRKLTKELITEIANLAPGGGIVKALWRAHMSERLQPPLAGVEAIRHKLERLIRAITGDNDNRRLVVLIDDLDRCAPPNMVRMFEWFKNHLIVGRRVTYVMGLDHRMAARAVAGHYRDYLGGAGSEMLDYGYSYLDKLIERDYEIQPSPHSEKMALMKLLKSGGSDVPNSISEWTRRELGKDFPGERYMTRFLERVPALWTPRVTIRVLGTYIMAFQAIKEQAKKERSLLDNDLKPAFPVWLFIISSLHHLFEPNRVESFVRGVGRATESERKTDPERKRGLGDLLGGLEENDPRHSLIDELNKSHPPMIPADHVQYLYRVVKEKTPRSLKATPLL